MNLAILPLLFIFMNGAGQPVVGPTEEVALNREFTIRMGETARVEGGLTISFASVEEDSRCPEGVACVWAGNGKILLKVSQRGRTPGKINLNTTLDPKESSYNRFKLKLLKLDPQRKKDVQVKNGDYQATLIVSRK